MGKDSPKEAKSKISRQNLRSKYLRPGALAQIRYAKASASVAKGTDMGKKRVSVLDTRKADRNIMLLNKNIQGSPLMLSPSRFLLGPFAGTGDIILRNSNCLRTPKTPASQDSESRLEALPFDVQVKIICLLHHDQLRTVFHVSRKVRKAVLMARQFHFNYTTPDRARRDMLTTISPRQIEHHPFIRSNEEEGNGMMRTPSPHTPKAPRHGPRPPPRYKVAEMRQISSVLFQDSVFPSRYIIPSVLPNPLCSKSLASNRVLVYEDELCMAVAKNKLR